MHKFLQSLKIVLFLFGCASITTCVQSLRLQQRTLRHKLPSTYTMGMTGKANNVLFAVEESNPVRTIQGGFLQQIKRSALPVFVSIALTRAAILPVGAKVSRKDVASSTNTKQQPLKKDTRKDSKGATAAANKKLVRVSLDVSDEVELLQKWRKEQLTKIGLAMAAACTLYVLLPSSGEKPPKTGADSAPTEDVADLQQIKPSHTPPAGRKPSNVETEVTNKQRPMRGIRSIPKEAPRSNWIPRKATQRSDDKLSGPDDILFEGEQSIENALQPDHSDAGVGKRGSRNSGEGADATPRARKRKAANKPKSGAATREGPEAVEESRGDSETESAATGKAESSKQASSSPPPPPSVPEVPPYASITPAPASSKLSGAGSPAKPVSAPAPPAAAPAKKGMGFLGRFFQKAGGGRPTDLPSALRKQGESQEMAHYRALVAENLLECMPMGSLPDDVLVTANNLLTEAGVGVEDEAGGERQVLSLQEAAIAAGLSESTAAEAYAEVTNALLVTLIDAAAATVDSKDATASVERLDALASFVEKTGKLYHELFPAAVVVDPIQYNGKTKAGKLEELYYRYARASMDMKSALAGLLGGGAAAGAADGSAAGDGGGVDATATDGATDPESAVAATVTAEQRAAKLGQIQFLFGLKDSKTNSLQQRLMKDIMLDMTQGGGDMDLSKLMGSMMGNDGSGNHNLQQQQQFSPGNSGNSGPPFPADFDYDSFAEALRTGGEFPKNIPGMPDMGDMNPEEMQAVARQAQIQMRQMLQDGTLTKQEVMAFEKMIGSPVEGLLKTMGVDRLSRQELQALGPDAADLVDMLKQLAAVKKR